MEIVCCIWKNGRSPRYRVWFCALLLWSTSVNAGAEYLLLVWWMPTRRLLTVFGTIASIGSVSLSFPVHHVAGTFYSLVRSFLVRLRYAVCLEKTPWWTCRWKRKTTMMASLPVTFVFDLRPKESHLVWEIASRASREVCRKRSSKGIRAAVAASCFALPYNTRHNELEVLCNYFVLSRFISRKLHGLEQVGVVRLSTAVLNPLARKHPLSCGSLGVVAW